MIGELTGFFDSSVEAVDDPRLLGMMFFMKSQDIGSGFDIVDNQRLFVLFREQDVLFKDFQLEIIGVFMKTVETSLANGGNFVFFEESY